MWHPSPQVPTTGGIQILFRRSSLHDSLQPVFLQEDRKYLRCKAACAPFALAGGNEFAQAPCAHVRGHDLSPVSRRCTSSFVPHGRTRERQCGTQVHKPPPKEECKYCFAGVAARQLTASVHTRGQEVLACKAACAPFALAGGNEIFVRVPCTHLGGNELSTISRRLISSSFHMVGPASGNAAPKSTSPHHRRKANTVSPKFPARQLAASVPTRGQEVLAQ